ncbi:uncharacterized protein LOC117653393 [Thrips palmi]|uniref:Gustatory receptor n=1 Tax=Thrips palmi TaxID=161013 RepID=A0A6P9AA30_THRPL|nr:uncharacterized protein LOC117653393 [Thrips palmi]
MKYAVPLLMAAPAEETYINLVFTAGLVAKTVAAAIERMVVVRCRLERTALVQGIVRYTTSCPPKSRAWRGMVLVLMAFVFWSLFIPGVILYLRLVEGMPFERHIVFLANTLVPTVCMSLSDCAFAAVLAACVFLAEDVAEDAEREMAGLSGATTLADLDKARAVRALRTRQQRLHDVVLACNQAHGASNLCWLSLVVLESCVFLFFGMAYIRDKLSGHKGRDGSGGAIGLLWGCALIIRFIANCILGQRLCHNHGRISEVLQGLLAVNPCISNDTIKEVRGFFHQVLVQDNRCGVFDLLYFDLKTMTAVIGSFTTFLVILFQFESDVSTPQAKATRHLVTDYTQFLALWRPNRTFWLEEISLR